MHCPRCGQEQVSEAIRFCSRCGLPLDLVAEVVANNGTLPQLSQIETSHHWLTRRNGLKFGLAWFLIFTFLITPLSAIAELDEIVAFFAIIGFMGGILIMIFSMMFLKKQPTQLQSAVAQKVEDLTKQIVGGKRSQKALSPHQTQPAQDYISPPEAWKSFDTDDLVQPRSVTEETTKLLKKEK